jgi:hypothetical protein
MVVNTTNGRSRFEACKQLGEEAIVGYVVQGRRH